jgi:7-cyano-7-deazaguanine synthase
MAALVLLSGGLDSTVACALYRADGGQLALGLVVDYGQRAAQAEARAAEGVGAALGFEVRQTRLDLLREVTRTALVALDRELPHPDVARLDQTAAASADAVWVPNRNGVLIALAAALAESEGLEHVLVGFNAEEAGSFPDNGPGFLTATNQALGFSTRESVSVVAPTLHMTKLELLAAGRAVGAPLDLTWSCYEGGDIPCARCESCIRRQRAEQALASRG